MLRSLIALFFFVTVASAQWPRLMTTFGPIPGLGAANDEQPRTQAELEEQGWVMISSCADNNPNWPGDRYVRSVDDKDMVIILDGNGFIAGMQTVVMKEYALDDAYFPFSSHPNYVLGDWAGEEAYFATVYFVDTEIICNGGRTQEEFDAQGTGYRLSFQNGPTNQDLQFIPLVKDEMLGDAAWDEHLCFTNMGDHFFNFPVSAGQDYDCFNDLGAFQVVYHNGVMNGFVFQHVGTLPGDRWEDVPRIAIPSIASDPPPCLLDLATEPGVTTMHVWVTDYLILC